VTRAETANDFADLAVDALASYRLTKLVRDDMITEPLREAVHERVGDPAESKLAYLVNCPWCLSIWFGAGLVILRWRWPKVGRGVARALAVSALTGMITQQLDADR